MGVAGADDGSPAAARKAREKAAPLGGATVVQASAGQRAVSTNWRDRSRLSMGDVRRRRVGGDVGPTACSNGLSLVSVDRRTRRVWTAWR
jgi:hypothetical protein